MIGAAMEEPWMAPLLDPAISTPRLDCIDINSATDNFGFLARASFLGGGGERCKHIVPAVNQLYQVAGRSVPFGYSYLVRPYGVLFFHFSFLFFLLSL
ncbi:uncharacterized protein BDW47DRAFT_107803 [Aspergillus candidus]|uniref:Uncharacterized protein n=1 Tax=Aspergillus candidus TaxID=41067 RepID=A0A2I2F894_ASPCN|nr:hypothetical protein BDW47DRAFT_107803 [Aspergillus candidus]PLB36850.1 hypothetical protein BDW47DRAFT_107803 [Aspergillus candidus]